MEDERISKLWELYERGRAYQRQLGLDDKIKTQVDFYEGRQWSAKASADFPKPVLNLVKAIVRNKRAGVLGSPVTVEYESSDSTDAGRIFTEFAQYVSKEIKQDDLDAAAILDGAVKGTYVYHYYWNPSARGLEGKIEGGIDGEVIDPLNVYFANPSEKDEQKQEYIIISHRLPVSTVRELAEKGIADLSQIVPDDAEQVYTEKTEQNDTEYCTVLTRYFRIDGEVYFEKAVKGTMLHSPRSLTPDVRAVTESDDEPDAGTATVPDIESEENDIEPLKATLYPISVGAWDEKNGTIYGTSEVEGLLPNQKIINFMLGMYCLQVQHAAAGKFIALPNALRNQIITNEPGQILIDNSGTGNGIRRLQEPPVSPAAINLVSNVIEMTRTVAGATEVMMGEQISANMSGAAIAQLQMQAQKPIAEMQRRFWRVREKVGKIFEQFFKLFYDNKEYTYEGKESNINKAVFNGEEYQTTSFSCVVTAGPATQFSEALSISFLDNLASKGWITAQDYVKLYPRTAVPGRSGILKAVEENENNQVQQLTSTVEQMKQYIETQSKNFENCNTLISMNAKLKEQLLEATTRMQAIENNYEKLYREASEKIGIANNALIAQSNTINALQGGGDGMSQMQAAT